MKHIAKTFRSIFRVSSASANLHCVAVSGEEVQRGVSTKGANDLEYYNPHKWPNHWGAADLECLLRSHLVSTDTPPHFETLATLLREGDTKSLTVLLEHYVMPPLLRELDVDTCLAMYLNNHNNSTMRLQERGSEIRSLQWAFSRQPGNEKRTIAFVNSPRGSGKTQLIKWFVSVGCVNEMKTGRAIVRCCSITGASERNSGIPSWMTLLLNTNSIDKALCELIRTHVESVSGFPQDPFKYCDPPTAYATWMSETARYFRIESHNEVTPIIILDSCEALAEHDHAFLVHKSSGKPYSLLEAFCLAIPSPYRILVVGTATQIDMSDPVLLAVTNAIDIGPLSPLSEQGTLSAFRESWETEIGSDVARLLFHWAGGVPWLLRHIAHANHLELFHQFEEVTQCPGVALFWLSRRVASSDQQYVDNDEVLFPHVYSCLLASSTKLRVRSSSDRVAVNPLWRDLCSSHHVLTYDEVMTHSLGSYHPLTGRLASIGAYDRKTCRFVVPPIMFADSAMTRRDVPILPSQLHPFLTPEVVENFDRHLIGHLESHVFKKAFMYAVYARYLLEYWKDATSPWVSLAKVFDGAIHRNQIAAIDRFEVNLSSGVMADDNYQPTLHAVENAATYMGGCDDHHDAYIWCRHRSRAGISFAVPLQLWSSYQSTESQLHFLRKEFVGDVATQEPPLVLLVCATMSDSTFLETLANDAVILINATSMSSIACVQ
ncbi:Bodo-specific multi-copy gene family, putative [Bodo saltans]|uniref:Bodo-specific multi-copy gene family, putative n=1 Tax=Bodo saltans TaxID=75058 RepID=A0A0S4JGD0_BODSA|nr:Bodo-specific multi-copy gene family, putative [Bodo saltans]|eukprot:CUG89376.1 Bodo-specific multi-copy gene family, putative [Bodo saltans]